MSSNSKPLKSLRVSQLDVNGLDQNILDSLNLKLQNCLKYQFFGKFDANRFAPHFRTLLYALVNYFALVKNGQTIGQKLLQLRYGHYKTLQPLSRTHLHILNIALILISWKKSFSNSSHSITIGKWFEPIYHAATVINFLIFLYNGKYQNLLLRILGIRSVHVNPSPLTRSINTTFLRRELVWRGAAESTMFVLSFINLHKIRRYVSQLISSYKTKDDQVPMNFNICAFCKEIPIIPHQGRCLLHVYCYYCVSVAISNDSNTKCPSCEVVIGDNLKQLPSQKH